MPCGRIRSYKRKDAKIADVGLASPLDLPPCYCLGANEEFAVVSSKLAPASGK